MAVATAVKETGILMHARSIKGIMEGRKTQTRRITKPQPSAYISRVSPQEKRGDPPRHPAPYLDAYNHGPHWCWWDEYDRQGDDWIKCPYGIAGDRLWVRERLLKKNGEWLYHGDGTLVMVNEEDRSASLSWAHHKESEHCQSIHMPRWACRLVLEITDIRVERVQDISYNDVIAEGLHGWLTDEQQTDAGHKAEAKAAFARLWDDTNGKGAWERNDWVWCLSFQKV